MNLNSIANIISKINFDWTISLSDIISIFSVFVTAIIALITIQKTLKM